MSKTLLILEVSRKQDYIFASKKLRGNAARSAQIAYVTSSGFFEAAAGDGYSETENLIYSGGGHTVLQFGSSEQAREFARKVTGAALSKYRGMEIFAKQMPYQPELSPGENLYALSRALEEKKTLRKSAFRQMRFGVEDSRAAEDSETLDFAAETIMPPEGCSFPKDFGQLAGEDNFIAVVHIDGNAMGARVQEIYAGNEAWEHCCRRLKRFSQGIQKDFEQAFRETAGTVAEKLRPADGVLPIRPVILAGDDVCFVTAGKIGLECARIYLEKLAAMENAEQPGRPYSACAGVAVVHTKYPFHQAYQLAEELCSSAKKFGAEIDRQGGISAIDWHIEFGQLKGDLSLQRQDYETEDGNRMELRPLTVVVPEGLKEAAHAATEGFRSYSFFKGMCRGMQGECGSIARGTIKQLRTAFKQGESESEFFLQDRQIRDLLYHPFAAKYESHEGWSEAVRDVWSSGKMKEKAAFAQIGETKRCLFFDAIEMIDHCVFFEEAEG